MGKVKITLSVDTANITPENVESTCSFSDTNGSPKANKPKDFKTSVTLGDKMSWEGEPTDKSTKDSVAITEIVFDGGVNLLGEQKIPGSSGKVSAEVVAGASGDEEKYTVNFDVTSNGETKSYSIDPILDIRS